MSKRRFIASFLVPVMLLIVSVMSISIVHFITLEQIEERRSDVISEMLAGAIPEAEGFTELTDIDLAYGVTNVYAADNGAGYVIRVVSKAITEEHAVNVALTDGGRVVSAVLEPEGPQGAVLVSEDILNAYTKTMGNYNTSYTADVLSSCVETAREQLALIGGGVADEP